MWRPQAGPAILPRDLHGATRAVAYFTLTGFAFITTLNALIPHFGGYTTASYLCTYLFGALVGAVGLVSLRRPDWLPDWFWTVVPFPALGLIGLMDYLSQDVSVGGQLFFLWPALYTATFLPLRKIVTVLTTLYLIDFCLVLSMRGLMQAVWDTTSIMTGITLATIIIWTLRKRVDKLLDVLERQALTDTLTGLGNRRAFDRDLDHAVAHARRTGSSLCLLTVDVDKFKTVNDTWGHTAGDETLLSVAKALSVVTRESDVVARIGGDEFVALLTDCDPRHAARVASSLQEELLLHSEADRPSTTLSIGVAGLPTHADTREELIAASDAALYAAKAGGRNQVVVASDT